MASPQIENGYTRIANEIMEALAKVRIPGEARQVLDAVFRKTYGWNKREDKISLSQFEKMTGLARPSICRAIKKLLIMNIIEKESVRIGTTDYDTAKNVLDFITIGEEWLHEEYWK